MRDGRFTCDRRGVGGVRVSDVPSFVFEYVEWVPVFRCPPLDPKIGSVRLRSHTRETGLRRSEVPSGKEIVCLFYRVQVEDVGHPSGRRRGRKDSVEPSTPTNIRGPMMIDLRSREVQNNGGRRRQERGEGSGFRTRKRKKEARGFVWSWFG